MKMKLITATLLGLGIGISVANAAPVFSGPLYIKYDNAEQVSTSNQIDNQSGGTEGNWGIIRVNTIDAGTVTNPNADIDTGSNIFTHGVQGDITGMFYGIDFDQTDPTRTTAFSGFLDLYWHDATTPDAYSTADQINGGLTSISTNRTGESTYTGFTDGEFLVRLEFIPGIGIDSGDITHTVISTNNPSNPGLGGSAFNLASVVAGAMVNGKTGAWENSWNQNWFLKSDLGNLYPTAADVRLQSNYNLNTKWSTTAADGSPITGLTSKDPARVFAVPEPATIALLGAGLLGFGAARRRKA